MHFPFMVNIWLFMEAIAPNKANKLTGFPASPHDLKSTFFRWPI